MSQLRDRMSSDGAVLTVRKQSGKKIIVTVGKFVPVSSPVFHSDKVFKTAINQPLSGHKLVISIGRDGIDYADANRIEHAGVLYGMTVTASEVGASAEVKTSGEIEHAGWSFTANKPIFLGADGELTQVVPNAQNSKFQQQVATALTATKINLHIYPPTKLTSQ